MLKHVSLLTLLLLLPLWAFADPAILKGASGADCQLPLPPNPYVDELDYWPSDREGVNLFEIGGKAGVRCDDVDIHRKRGLGPEVLGFDITAVPLPYRIAYRGKNFRNLWCRIQDSDGNLYFTRNWASSLEISAAGPGLYRVEKRLLCREGIPVRKKAAYREEVQ